MNFLYMVGCLIIIDSACRKKDEPETDQREAKAGERSY